MTGRKPKPLETRRREGNPGHRPLTQPVLVGGRVTPMQPRGLTPTQVVAWRTIVADLEASGILDHADAGLIEAAAVFWGRARQARATVNREGLIAKSVRGYTAHPLLAVERESWGQFRMLAEQLGLGPVARARLSLGGKGKSMEDEIEDAIGQPARLRVVGGAS